MLNETKKNWCDIWAFQSDRKVLMKLMSDSLLKAFSVQWSLTWGPASFALPAWVAMPRRDRLSSTVSGGIWTKIGRPALLGVRFGWILVAVLLASLTALPPPWGISFAVAWAASWAASRNWRAASVGSWSSAMMTCKNTFFGICKFLTRSLKTGDKLSNCVHVRIETQFSYFGCIRNLLKLPQDFKTDLRAIPAAAPAQAL